MFGKINVIAGTGWIGDALKNHHELFLKYLSATGIRVLANSSICSKNSSDILKFVSNTDLGLTTMGKNGHAQSANLAGTVSISSGSTTLTGSGTAFTTDFIIGDIIYLSNSEGFQITNISSNTSMTVKSAAAGTYSSLTYKRGGLAPSAKYYLYVCKAVGGDGFDGCIISGRNVAAGETLVDVPSTLSPTEYRQVMESAIGGNAAAVLDIRTDSSKNLIAFMSSDSPAANCVAWAHVEGTVDASVTGTYSQSGTTVTVSVVNHGHKVGQPVYTDITSGSGVDGLYTVASVSDANTFTYTALTSLTTSGNLTLTRRKIRSGKNAAFVIKIHGHWCFDQVFRSDYFQVKTFLNGVIVQ